MPLAIVFAAPAIAENWPHWRGPLGTGVSSEKTIPPEWDDHQNVLWRSPLPDRGNSTPIVWDDRVFVTQAVEKDHRRMVMCFARKDGALLWQAGVTYADREPTNGQNPYCSASPTTDGKHVIAYFGSAGLFCFDFNGKELWRTDLGKVDSWQGSGSSPIIYKNLCFINAGPGTRAALVACDVNTGEIRWKITPPKVPGGAAAPAGKSSPPPTAPDGFDSAMQRADPTGEGEYLGSWATPLLHRQGDHDELIMVHPFQVSAYDPVTGREIWVCKGLPEQAFASPAIGEGLLIATGHKMTGGGTRVTAIQLGGQGDVSQTHRQWQTDLPKEYVSSGLISHGRLYLASQFGTLLTLDAKNGKKLWEKRLPAQGNIGGIWSSIVLLDDKLLISNLSADTFLVSATSPDFQLMQTNSLLDQTMCASPVISNGQVFLRTYQSLWCIGPRQ